MSQQDFRPPLSIRHSLYIDDKPEVIFKTLTTASGWNAWFTKETTLDLRPNGNMNLVWKNWGLDHVNVSIACLISEVIPNSKFSFWWNNHCDQTTGQSTPSNDYSTNGSLVTFTLEPRGNGTVLHLTDSGYEDMDSFHMCAVGWGEALTLLKFFIECGVTSTPIPRVTPVSTNAK